MESYETFAKERDARIRAQSDDAAFQAISQDWLQMSMQRKYVYNFEWLGRPIIQYPQDMVAVQELLWRVKPDLVIETGIAHGGSLILSASVLALMDMADAIESGELLDPRRPKRKVVGVDIDIREHNRAAIEGHPLGNRITMVQGSSIDPDVVAHVRSLTQGVGKVVVLLDSMHTHAHVLAELNAYAPLVTPGSYCVVFDTFVEDMPQRFFPDRPWDVGDNPKTAVRAWLGEHPEFVNEAVWSDKLMVTVAPEGFLHRIS